MLVIFSSGFSDSTLAMLTGPARCGRLRDLVHLQPVALPLVGEAEQVRLRGGDEEVLDEVVLAQPALHALAAAALHAVLRQRHPLDEPLVRDRHDVRLVLDQVFDVDVAAVVGDLGLAVVAVLRPPSAPGRRG